jgi:hypothetical protein
MALAGLGPVVATTVGVGQSDARCTVDQRSMDDPAYAGLQRLLERLDTGPMFFIGDRQDDFVSLESGEVSDGPGGLDILGASWGEARLNRSASRALDRALRGDLGRDLGATFGRPPGDWLENGTNELQIQVFHLAGDPTAPEGGSWYWQVAFQGTNPARSVAPTIPNASPLAGSQHLLTLAQVPQGEFAGHSNFGSNRAGASGTQYYNAPANLAGFWGDDWVAVLSPASYGGLGHRLMTYDADTGRWDYVVAPGGPLAYTPRDGSATGLLDLAGLVLHHDPVSLPGTIGNRSQADWPSGPDLIFGSQVFDPTRPVLVDLGYTVGDHEVVFNDLVAEPMDGGLHRTPFGIPQYGSYRFTHLSLGQDGIVIPETWEQLQELVRAMGTAGFTVDEGSGPLHGSLPGAWFGDSPPVLPPVYDPEAARLALEEAGWLPG